MSIVVSTYSLWNISYSINLEKVDEQKGLFSNLVKHSKDCHVTAKGYQILKSCNILKRKGKFDNPS